MIEIRIGRRDRLLRQAGVDELARQWLVRRDSEQLRRSAAPIDVESGRTRRETQPGKRNRAPIACDRSRHQEGRRTLIPRGVPCRDCIVQNLAACQRSTRCHQRRQAHQWDTWPRSLAGGRSHKARCYACFHGAIAGGIGSLRQAELEVSVLIHHAAQQGPGEAHAGVALPSPSRRRGRLAVAVGVPCIVVNLRRDRRYPVIDPRRYSQNPAWLAIESLLEVGDCDQIARPHAERSHARLELDVRIAADRFVQVQLQYAPRLVVVRNPDRIQRRRNLLPAQRHVVRIDHGKAVLLVVVQRVLKLHAETVRRIRHAARVHAHARLTARAPQDSGETVAPVSELVARPAPVQGFDAVGPLRLRGLLVRDRVLHTKMQEPALSVRQQQPCASSHAARHVAGAFPGLQGQVALEPRERDRVAVEVQRIDRLVAVRRCRRETGDVDLRRGPADSPEDVQQDPCRVAAELLARLGAAGIVSRRLQPLRQNLDCGKRRPVVQPVWNHHGKVRHASVRVARRLPAPIQEVGVERTGARPQGRNVVPAAPRHIGPGHAPRNLHAVNQNGQHALHLADPQQDLHPRQIAVVAREHHRRRVPRRPID